MKLIKLRFTLLISTFSHTLEQFFVPKVLDIFEYQILCLNSPMNDLERNPSVFSLINETRSQLRLSQPNLDRCPYYGRFCHHPVNVYPEGKLLSYMND